MTDVITRRRFFGRVGWTRGGRGTERANRRVNEGCCADEERGCEEIAFGVGGESHKEAVDGDTWLSANRMKILMGGKLFPRISLKWQRVPESNPI